MTVHSWRGSFGRPEKFGRLWRWAQVAFLLYYYMAFVICFMFTALIFTDHDLVVSTMRQVDVSDFDAFCIVLASFVSVPLFGAVLIRVTRRGYLGKSRRLAAWDRLIFARSERTFRPEITEIEAELLRSRITAEVYEQVMDQQRRGLLCPNCEGHGPGQKESA